MLTVTLWGVLNMTWMFVIWSLNNSCNNNDDENDNDEDDDDDDNDNDNDNDNNNNNNNNNNNKDFYSTNSTLCASQLDKK